MRLPGRSPKAGLGSRTPRGPRTSQPRPATALRARRRPGATQARRPGRPLRARLGGRLPSLARLVAALGVAGSVAALVALAGGSWLRIERIETGPTTFTSASRLADVLDPLRGRALLTLDRRAVEAQLTALPAVAEAHVEAYLPDRVAVTVTEETAALVWQTPAVQLVAAADGTVIGQVALGAALDATLAALPFVDDRRAASRDIVVGDRLPQHEVRTALRLAGIEPATLGSRAARLTVRVDGQYGFIVVAPEIGWSAAFGYYGMDPQEGDADVAARVQQQAASVRTLFASEPEATVAWVDARNPGRVYWRAKG